MRAAWTAVPLCVASLAMAQEATPRMAPYRGRVVGVFDASTGQAIEGAEVRDLRSNSWALTTTTGTVSLVFLPEGGSLVRIRKIGYSPLAQFIAISEGDTVPVTLILMPTVTLLEAVVTRDTARQYSTGLLRDFESRRKQGFGHFVTEDEIRKYDNRDMADVLRHLPGLKVACTNRSPRRCVAAPNHVAGTACRSFVIFVDGMRVSDPNLLLLHVEDYAGIEEYDGASTLPPKFASSGNGCGTLLFWSREK